MATRMREKSAKRAANADKRPHATAKYIRISSRKVKTVIKLVEIHTYANTSTDHYADYTVALQHVRGG